MGVGMEAREWVGVGVGRQAAKEAKARGRVTWRSFFWPGRPLRLKTQTCTHVPQPLGDPTPSVCLGAGLAGKAEPIKKPGRKATGRCSHCGRGGTGLEQARLGERTLQLTAQTLEPCLDSKVRPAAYLSCDLV